MRILASTLCALALGAACGDGRNAPIDDPDDPGDPDAPRQFTMRIENVAPWHVLKLSSQRTRTTRVEGNLNAGDAYEIRFTAAPGHRLTFATMMLDSNDWFVGTDPDGIPIYTDGTPLTGDITGLLKLWDAGTEFDQEPGVGDATGVKQATREAGQPDVDAVVRLVPANAVLDTGATFAVPPLAAIVKATMSGPDRDGVFTLRLENVSTTTTLVTSQGTTEVHLSPAVWAVHREGTPFFDAELPVRPNGFEFLAEAGQPDPLITALRFDRGVSTALSPGVFVLHRNDAPLFTTGTPDYGLGLEALAEDGNPETLYGAMRNATTGIVGVGMFDAPAGAAAGPARPGQAFEVTFEAAPGDRISFATMFAASNDWFFAPKAATGIELFYGNNPRWGDVTPELALFDLGTEIDQELDVGPTTAPHQSAPDTGVDDRFTNVREVALGVYDVPESYHLRVTLLPAL